MTKKSIIFLSTLGIAAISGGAAAWAHYGGVIFFDVVSAGFTGCFF